MPHIIWLSSNKIEGAGKDAVLKRFCRREEAVNDSAIFGGILSAGVGHAVVARSTVIAKAALFGPAAQRTEEFSVLARTVALTTPCAARTGIESVGKTPVDTKRWHYTLLENINDSVDRCGKDHTTVRTQQQSYWGMRYDPISVISSTCGIYH